MAVSSAIIDLTDDDVIDVMHMDGGQVAEETVTSSSWTNVSNSNEHDNK